MIYLLDTNACIRVLNNSSPKLVAELRKKKPMEIALCSIVKAELTYGAYHSARPAENLRLLEKFFQPFISFPFDDTCAFISGKIRDGLSHSGTPIGPNDLLIAAIAIANQLTLVTANTREFTRVIGLSLENWELGKYV